MTSSAAPLPDVYRRGRAHAIFALASVAIVAAMSGQRVYAANFESACKDFATAPASPEEIRSKAAQFCACIKNRMSPAEQDEFLQVFGSDGSRSGLPTKQQRAGADSFFDASTECSE